jgi:ADP-heptose:LPS heptosyltransferase
MNNSRMKFFDLILTHIVKNLPRKKLFVKPPKRILVIKFAAMGDALCLMPAIKYLKNLSNDLEIDFLTTSRTNPSIFQKLKFINKIEIMPTSLLKLGRFIIFDLYKFRNYDLIIDCEQYYQFSELISYLGRHSIGFKTPIKGSSFSDSLEYDAKENEKISFLNLVKLVKIRATQIEVAYLFDLPELTNDFKPAKKLTNFAQKLKDDGLPVVIIYPGSSSNASFRRWDLEYFRDVIAALRNNCNFVIAGGPDEIDLKPNLSSFGLSDCDFIGQWSLDEWLWIFQNVADLFVGNDGGLLHLAESQNLPIIGLFGPALYSKWGSLNPNSIGLEINLSCRPCLRNYEGHVPQHCEIGSRACLRDIEPKRVIDVILQKTNGL